MLGILQQNKELSMFSTKRKKKHEKYQNLQGFFKFQQMIIMNKQMVSNWNCFTQALCWENYSKRKI